MLSQVSIHASVRRRTFAFHNLLLKLRFNTRLREEANYYQIKKTFQIYCFNTRLREEANISGFTDRRNALGFNTRLREEAN